MDYKHQFILDFKSYLILFFLLVIASVESEAQTILRQSLSSLGNSVHSEGITVQSTVGQSGAIGAYSYSDGTLRQGFIQPPSSKLGVILPKVQIAVYPNPSTGWFTIDMEFKAGDSYRVVDILGKEVLSAEIQNTTTNETFNLSSYSKGFYFLTIVRDGKALETKKLILAK